MFNLFRHTLLTRSGYFIVLISIFSITYFGSLNGFSQDRPSELCLRTCENKALKGIKECKKLSNRCVRDNSKNVLNILDYCTDSYLGSCESTVNGNYQSCVSELCGVNIIEARNLEAFDPDNPSPGISCSSGGDTLLNAVLTEMQDLVNKDWEQSACNFGLCPLEPVFVGNINLGCKGPLEAGLIATCSTLSATTAPACKDFYVDVVANSLNGIQFGQYEDFKITEIHGASGTQVCPNNKNANNGLDLACSYTGTGTGSASLKMSELTLQVESLVVHLRCTNGIFNENFILYNGNVTCNTANPSGTAEYALCGGSCDQVGGDLGGVITYLQIPTVNNLQLDLGSTFKCEFRPEANPVSAFLDEFVPAFRKQITEALKQPIQETLNSIIPGLPYPADACKSGS